MTDTTKAKPNPDQKHEYDVVAVFWDGPKQRIIGETVMKTETEAKYLTPSPLCRKGTAAKANETEKPPQSSDPKGKRKTSGGAA